MAKHDPAPEDLPPPNEIPASDEVMSETEKRQQLQKFDADYEAAMQAQEDQLKAEAAENEQREKELRQASIDEHNKRVDDAKAFDWNAWEKETGLTRPEIPKKIK